VISPTFGPERNEAQWQTFVAAVPACASAVGSTDTVACIRAADSAALLTALTATAGASKSFVPVIDGPGGLLPDRPSLLALQARLPTLVGTNRDEGTLFTPQGTDSASQISALFMDATTPSAIVSPVFLAETVQQIEKLYPDMPALGSPFGTGNATFGLDSEFKRFAAVCKRYLVVWMMAGIWLYSLLCLQSGTSSCSPPGGRSRKTRAPRASASSPTSSRIPTPSCHLRYSPPFCLLLRPQARSVVGFAFLSRIFVSANLPGGYFSRALNRD
jgi:hypothetical protein